MGSGGEKRGKEDIDKLYGETFGELDLEEWDEEFNLDRVRDGARDIFEEMIEDISEDPGQVFNMQDRMEEFLELVLEEAGTDMEELESELAGLDEEERDRLENLLNRQGTVLMNIPYKPPNEEIFRPLQKAFEEANRENREDLEKVFAGEVDFLKLQNGFQRAYYSVATAEGLDREVLNQYLNAVEKFSEGVYKPLIVLVGKIYATSRGNSSNVNFGAAKQNLQESELDFSELLIENASGLRNSPAHLSYSLNENEVLFERKDGTEFELGKEELDERLEGMARVSKNILYSLKKLYVLNLAEVPDSFENREEYWELVRDRHSGELQIEKD